MHTKNIFLGQVITQHHGGLKSRNPPILGQGCNTEHRYTNLLILNISHRWHTSQADVAHIDDSQVRPLIQLLGWLKQTEQSVSLLCSPILSVLFPTPLRSRNSGLTTTTVSPPWCHGEMGSVLLKGSAVTRWVGMRVLCSQYIGLGLIWGFFSLNFNSS